MVASPLTRAMETAAIVASRLGLAPEVDPRLAETDTGDWTDRTYADVIATDGQDVYDRFRALEPAFGAPGGETFADVTGLTVGNVGFIMHVAIKKLRELLNRELATPSH